ncbi:MAG TPA: TIM-barrel domain-containing protein [Chitinophagaceae bacterium]|nr:TIM-barrel domain-containing protein [Chitinophagaceae bacterium]
MPTAPGLSNHPLDLSLELFQPLQDLFVASEIGSFDETSGEGTIRWKAHRWKPRSAFGTSEIQLLPCDDLGVLWKEQDLSPEFPFRLSFPGAGTIRIRIGTGPLLPKPGLSLMIPGNPEDIPVSEGWNFAVREGVRTWSSPLGTLRMDSGRFGLELLGRDGEPLTRTLGGEILQAPHPEALPFLFLQRASDRGRSITASFSLSPGERIYGCGESFTTLDKRGQKLVLFSTDARSVQTSRMYKPVPFFISSRGYGMFLHSTAPVTLDFGKQFGGSTLVHCGEDTLDLFLFIGEPREVLSRYTALTGRAPLPPIWSFGLWMGKLSYQSQEEVLSVAGKLREHRVPCDVIHIDAGWFRRGVNCDFQFAPDRFPDPPLMITRLMEQGLRVSLWQLPYFTRGNPVYEELLEEKLYIRDRVGGPPGDELMPDLSKPRTRQWYMDKIRPLLKMGVSAIKADFGEAAPVDGLYYSGDTGLLEHHRYPLRYAGLLYQAMESCGMPPLIWARSGWAGCQRYPVHWGGDSEATDNGMACTLRGGLSLGLSGFSFWSHDIGGFFSAPGEDLMLRWSFFGLLSSHSRIHGTTAKEPWLFSPQALATFVSMAELRYRLIPYLYTQSAMACAQGLPLLRPLLLEDPRDPACWLVEDQYLLGEDLLVAPLMEGGKKERDLYLPTGEWIDYQTGKIYLGKQWVRILAGALPGILLVRSGALIPHIALAQSTAFLDWSTLRMVAFGTLTASGSLLKPGWKEPVLFRTRSRNGVWEPEEKDPGNTPPVTGFGEPGSTRF